MPSAALAEHQSIDWSGIRAASVAVGVREAARQAARDLPTEEQERFVQRVMKRSSREGWMSAATSARAIAGPREPGVCMPLPQPLSASVRNGAEIVQDTLLSDGKATKIALMRAARLASEYAAELPPDLILAEGANLKAVAGVASIAGSWAAGVTVNTQVNLLSGGSVDDL